MSELTTTDGLVTADEYGEATQPVWDFQGQVLTTLRHHEAETKRLQAENDALRAQMERGGVEFDVTAEEMREDFLTEIGCGFSADECQEIMTYLAQHATVVKPEPSPPSDWEAKVEAAHNMVSALCKGERRWTMSVPVQEEHDSDCIITAGLVAAEDRIKELESVRPEPIASAETLEQLAEVGADAWGTNIRIQSDSTKQRWCDAVTATLQAAKPYVHASWEDIRAQWKSGSTGAGDYDWLNSRIRYSVQLPEETPAYSAHMQHASETVSKWPEWKQNVLAHTQPTEPASSISDEDLARALSAKYTGLDKWPKATPVHRDIWLSVAQRAKELIPAYQVPEGVTVKSLQGVFERAYLHRISDYQWEYTVGEALRAVLDQLGIDVPEGE